jgi:glyoxylate reductase
MHILITRHLPEAAPAALRAAGHTVTLNPHDRPLSPAELLELSKNADALLSMLTDKIDAAFLEKRPNLKAIANYAVGYNNIDVPAATAKKIGVSNTPGVLTNATAEIAWTLLMAAARRAGEGERLVRSKTWAGWEPLQLLGTDIVGKTLGLIGAGRIGTRVAKMAAGFDMQILYNNRNPNPAMEALGARLVPLNTLLQRSDFISLHVPLTDITRHLLGREQFKMMKPTAVLINTARGPVIDEAALVEALKNKTIFAAGLDVYEHEPALHPGLYELDNAILLPHLGSATIETRNLMAHMAADNLIAMLAGKRPPNPVNPELWP